MNEHKPNTAYGAMESGSETPAPPYTGRESNVEPPPTYHDTQNEAPPPSYESLYGEIQEARRKAQGRGDFLKNVCKILLGTSRFIGYYLSLISMFVYHQDVWKELKNLCFIAKINNYCF